MCASSNVRELSLNALQWMLGALETMSCPWALISMMTFMSRIALRRDSDRLIYLASVVLSVICVCNFDVQKIGQPAKVIMNLVQDLAVLMSCAAIDLFQLPSKSASAYTLSDLSSHGSKMSPLFRVSRRYLQSHSTASPCDCFGSCEIRTI